MQEFSLDPPRVLLVMERIEDVKTLGGQLARERIPISRAQSLDAAVDALREGRFDALLIALPLTARDALSACAWLAEQQNDLPPIVLLAPAGSASLEFASLPPNAQPARQLSLAATGAEVASIVREVCAERRNHPEPSARPSVMAPNVDRQFAREAVFARRPANAGASSARPIVASSPPRPASDAAKPAQREAEAEGKFQLGRGLLKVQRFEAAANALSRAVALCPDDRSFRLYEAWAQYLVASSAQRSARERTLALAREMIASEPSAAKPRTIVGMIALDDGDAATARGALELALELNPDDDDAANALEAARAPITKK